MIMKNSRWLADWSGVVGVGVLALGLVLGSTLTGWTAVPFVMIVTGAVLLLVWVFTHQSLLSQFFGLRSTQNNTNILISVLAVLVILAGLNVLAARYEAKFDLTREGLYTLSPQTVRIVKELLQPVKVWAVSSGGDAGLREQLRQQLQRYQQLNPKQFQFEFLNPRNAPEQAKRLEVNRDEVMVVESGTRKQQFPQPLPPDLESSLTPAIGKVINTQTITAYFVEGHGELPLSSAPGTAGLAQAVKGLQDEGYTAKPINLVESEIPADAGLIVVAGPQRAFFAGEVEKLKTYVDQGGKLLLMINPQTDVGLDPLLEEWGVKLGNDVIVDVSEVGQLLGTGPSVALVTNYGSHPITADFNSPRQMTLFPFARSVSSETKTGIQATQLLQTSPKSWGETELNKGNNKVQFDPDKDLAGPLGLGVALSRTVEGEITPALPETGSLAAPAPSKEGRLVVIGNSSFAADSTYSQQGNSDFFLNTINWLAEQKERISIRPKSITNRSFQLTQKNLSGLALLSILILPILALAVGGYIWWQRR